MTLEEIVNRFLDWCQPPRRAAATVRAYRSRLKPVVKILGEKPLQAITPIELHDAVEQANRDKAPDTQRLTIVVVERLQRWCVDFELIEKPIFAKFEKPRGRKRERLPTEEETAAILENGPPDFAVIYQALRRSGARPNELCRATVANIDSESGSIVLQEHKTGKKTGEPRVIAVGDKLQALIDQSLSGRTEGHLFLRSNGKPWTTNALGAVFRRLRDRLGLSKDLCVYLARHEHATKLCALKGIKAAADALGHKNLQTTARYTKRVLDDMKKNQDLFE